MNLQLALILLFYLIAVIVHFFVLCKYFINSIICKKFYFQLPFIVSFEPGIYTFFLISVPHHRPIKV